MNLFKGTLGIRGHVILYVLICLLVSKASCRSGDKEEKEKSSLELKLHLLQNKYRHLCDLYTSLAHNCSGPAISCKECPENWLHVGDQCFLLSTDRLNWLNSTNKCTEMGSHLAILTTKEQHEAVEKEGRRIGGLYTHYWIGLNDIENEGVWKWTDGSILTHPFWNVAISEPDDNKSGGEEGEDCAVVDSYGQSWSDVPCSFLYPRICQMEATMLKPQ